MKLEIDLEPESVETIVVRELKDYIEAIRETKPIHKDEAKDFKRDIKALRRVIGMYEVAK